MLHLFVKHSADRISSLQENLSANVRQEAERKMVALEDELNGKEQKAKERKYSQKYHKVRFFGR